MKNKTSVIPSKPFCHPERSRGISRECEVSAKGGFLKRTKRLPRNDKQFAFSIVEILVCIGVLSTIIFAVTRLFFVSQETAEIGKEKTKATALNLEYLEKTKNIQHADWNLLNNGRYIINEDGGILSLVSTTSGELVDNFTRYINISPVYRNQSGDIVDSSGTLDLSTKKIAATCSWTGLHPSQITQSKYLTRYYDNLSWQQSTVSDFEGGQMDLVKITDPTINNGEIELLGGCQGGSPESLIYDDQLQNGWRTNCSGLGFWEWLLCKFLTFFSNGVISTNSADFTYNESSYSMKIQLYSPSSGSWRSWVKIFNYDEICTIGFRNLHFYAYNPTPDEIEIDVTAVYGQWDERTITIPPVTWTEISLDYEQIGEDYENNLEAIYFSKIMDHSDPTLVFYVDAMDLTGGVGGFFTEGTLISSVLDTNQSSAFNRISFSGQTFPNTLIGFQTAISENADGPWLYHGPAGTDLSDDLYTDSEGQGIYLGANIGRYFRYKAFLKSIDGQNTPILYDFSVNYSP
ncbi:hypothetical protein KKA02_04000 [Patescibacteria group bacterium]|nr:hypothetical protein [Patescibacteria group bacterium]